MPGFLFHIKQLVTCPHSGQVQTTSTNTKVLVNGLPVATMTDISIIAGCTLNVSGEPHPCVKVLWTAPATKVFVTGQPVLLASSIAICQSVDQAPQGPPVKLPPQQMVGGI